MARVHVAARVRAVLCATALALLIGCASAREMKQAEEAPAASPVEDTQEEREQPLAHDPQAKLAGGQEQAPPPRLQVRFREPADPRAVATRPALPPRARLAVAAVDRGLLVAPGQLLLHLDAELAGDEELEAVEGPGGDPDPPEVDLAGLARIAHAAKRELLLVDVRPSRRQGALRDGYLVHAATGALLAWWSVEREVPLAPTGDAPDLPDRIALAHARIGE